MSNDKQSFSDPYTSSNPPDFSSSFRHDASGRCSETNGIERWINADQGAEFLEMSRRCFWRKVRRGLIPGHPIVPYAKRKSGVSSSLNWMSV